MRRLDLDSLRRAVEQLDAGLAEAAASPASELLRDGVIQRFEYTYELAWKMLKRFLEATAPNAAAIDAMSFPDLIRTGSEQGLLSSGWDVWKDYRRARGTSSHTYDAAKAREVFAIVPRFLKEARALLSELERRNHGES